MTASVQEDVDVHESGVPADPTFALTRRALTVCLAFSGLTGIMGPGAMLAAGDNCTNDCHPTCTYHTASPISM